MHPQLADYKYRRCEDLIKALEECHQLSFVNKAMGRCNNIKADLDKCLASSRLDKAKYNLDKAKERRARVEEKWKRAEEEEYGKNNKLKMLEQLEKEGKI